MARVNIPARLSRAVAFSFGVTPHRGAVPPAHIHSAQQKVRTAPGSGQVPNAPRSRSGPGFASDTDYECIGLYIAVTLISSGAWAMVGRLAIGTMPSTVPVVASAA